MSVQASVVALNAISIASHAAWDDLANHASEPNPFYERWFLTPSIAHLSPPDDASCLVVWHQKNMIGLMPICRASRYARLPIQHVSNWQHYNSFYSAPLVRKGAEALFWTSALDTFDSMDWEPNFLHITGLNPDTPLFHALSNSRRCDIVHWSERALLQSDLSSIAYYETNIRKKKRKEIGRLLSRLNELGTISYDRMQPDADIDLWIANFLMLEAAGWKGTDGAALARNAATRTFFIEALKGAHAAGRLEMLRLSLDGRPLAMLVNFITRPGSYSFKIAFDEDFARFSPGVLISIENLKHLDRRDIGWMDSCAVPDHPMINSIWAERRPIVRATVPLNGARRRAMFIAARTLEKLSALRRRKA